MNEQEKPAANTHSGHCDCECCKNFGTDFQLEATITISGFSDPPCDSLLMPCQDVRYGVLTGHDVSIRAN